MRKVFYGITILGILLAVSFVARSQDKLFGNPIADKKNITEIKKILAAPADFLGKTVTLKGTIQTECPSGCWFYLKDDTGVIYIDLAPSGFAIPQWTRKKVYVQGIIKNQTGVTIVAAKGVELL